VNRRDEKRIGCQISFEEGGRKMAGQPYGGNGKRGVGVITAVLVFVISQRKRFFPGRILVIMRQTQHALAV
jgi:hypothetical protein